MTKKNEQAYKAYKKSNMQRRESLLLKAGFATEQDYFKHLGVPTPASKAKVAKKASKASTKKTVKPVKVAKVSVKKKESKPLDYVIAFDTTGSMASYIQAVREHAKKLVRELFENSKNLRVKIVAFGDYCDMTGPGNFGDAYQTIELTDNVNTLIKFIDKAKDTTGGDSDEFYELVIKKINEETSWRKDATKSVLFIADCNPHKPGYNYAGIVTNAQIDWRVEARNAKTLGIQYDTLRIIPGNKWYKDLSDITGGVCMDFKTAKDTDKIIAGTVYARTNPEMFKSMATSSYVASSVELSGAYKTMSTLVDEDK